MWEEGNSSLLQQRQFCQKIQESEKSKKSLTPFYSPAIPLTHHFYLLVITLTRTPSLSP
jgi:hypothetical protein